MGSVPTTTASGADPCERSPWTTTVRRGWTSADSIEISGMLRSRRHGADLINDVRSLDLSQGLEASMVRKLERAQAALADGSADRTTSACNLLNAFAWEVEAQSGKAIAADQSQALVEKAEQVATALGCPKGVSP